MVYHSNVCIIPISYYVIPRALLRDVLVKFINKNTKVKFGSRSHSYMLREIKINVL
jgi:hypothetical protein